ncbi:MAG: SprT family zinc-dependent metalloprotease [Myxococcota bacterium]
MTAPFDPLPHLERWTTLWSCPELAAALTVRFTTRLRTSLGRCHAQRGELRLAAYLLEAPRPLLLEVLCHEAAHAAVFALHGAGPRPHGSGPRPHGPEWKGLMGAAGLVPRVRIPASELAALPAPAQRARVVWDHRCPLGHARRLAGRPMRRWRCVACRNAGLSGVLVIERTSADVAARTPFPAPLAALSSAEERPRRSRGLHGRGLERLRRAFGGAPEGRASS